MIDPKFAEQLAESLSTLPPGANIVPETFLLEVRKILQDALEGKSLFMGDLSMAIAVIDTTRQFQEQLRQKGGLKIQ